MRERVALQLSSFLVFDIGTSGGKSAIVDDRGRVLALRKEEWSAREPPGLEFFGREFDASEVESKLLTAALQVLHESKVTPRDIKDITATSLRFGYVFLDSTDGPVYFGSNMDGRGFFTQDIIEDRLGDRIYEITGLRPPLLYCLSKLLWFRENAPEKFRRISKVMNLNDWWLYKLSGEFSTDQASASTTGLYDIARRRWSDEILSAFGLNPGLLPEITTSGNRIGYLKEKFRSILGLASSEVFVCGPDTQCGLLGSGCTSDGELGVVAGATAPCQMVTSNHSVGPGNNVLIGDHVLPGKYVVECNAGQCGLSYDWAVRTYAENESYQLAEDIMSKIDTGPTGLMSFIGSQIMNLDKLHVIKPSMTLFSSPVVPPFFRADRGTFLKAVLEEACFAISCNIDILEEATGVTPVDLKVTGGLTRSNTFCQALSGAAAKRVHASSDSSGTILGAALCVMVGSGKFASWEEAVKKTLSSRVIEPEESKKGDYAEARLRWKQLYYEITELSEAGKL